MEYCSLSEAFPEPGGGPAASGCNDNKAGSAARREERKKAKRCKGPPLTFLEAPGDQPVTDPDRPALRPMPEVPALNSSTGLREHHPVDSPQNDPFTDYNSPPCEPVNKIKQLIQNLRSQQPPDNEAILNTMPNPVAGPNRAQPSVLPKFFGANYDSEDDTFKNVDEGFTSFTNVIGDDPGYHLSPDFTSAFDGKGVNKASGDEVLPIPSVNTFWKPLTPGGANTSFFKKLPLPGGTIPVDQAKEAPPYNKEEFFKRLDSIYSRLDDLETKRGDNAQTEVLLFIMSGIFILFSMDLLVRKTGNVRILSRK